MKRIVEKSTQNVNSNAGIFLAKQILDRLPALAKFDSDEASLRSIANRIYSNSSIAKAEVALMTLGKTSFCDIVAHQKDSLFADAAGGAIPSEATFRQRLEYLSTLSGVTNWIDEANVELLSMVEDFGLVKTQFAEYLPIDIDVSVFVNDNCKKENVAFTYHRINGFDERMWIEQAHGECGEPAYAYNDENNGRVEVFRGVVSHLHTKSTNGRALFCVWEVKRMKRDDELFPRYSTATWWTNLSEDANTVIQLYSARHPLLYT